MNLLSAVRIATVVGLSAIKLVSTALKVKEARSQGLINPIFVNNNSTPYTTNQPMTNNMYNSNPVQTPMTVQQPVWTESRRFMNTNPQPQIVSYQTPQPQVPIYQASYQNNTTPVAPVYDTQSRRYSTATPVYNPTTYISSNWQNPVQQPIRPMTFVGPTIAQYNPMQYSMNINNNYDSLAGYVPKRNNMYNNYQSPMNYQYQSNNQELKWCDKSYGQMMEERRMMLQPQLPPKIKHRAPMFNWNSPWLKYDPLQAIDKSGVVPMFCMDDGTPLYGPVPNTV